MKKMTYTEFLASVSIQYEFQDPPNEMRYGQMYMNAMKDVNPRVADILWGSVNDPFYRDNVPPHVHELVEKMWASA
jgi:hypothetical protein